MNNSATSGGAAMKNGATDDRPLRVLAEGRQYARRGNCGRRGQEGRCHFSWRDHEEGTAAKERFQVGKIMQSCR